MRRIVIISISIVCVALIGLAVAAGPGKGGWRHSPEEKIEHVKLTIHQKLKLDEAQAARLDRIAEDILAEHQQISQDRDAFKADFKALLEKEQVNSEELLSLFETKKPVIDSMMRLASKHIAEFHSVLTPEQRETFIALMASHQGRRCRFMR